MRLNLVLLPDKGFTQNIFNLRKQVVDMKLGNIDKRANVLPHVTVLYFEENLSKDKTNEVIQLLRNLQIKRPITLDIKEITNWEHKVVAIFNTSPVCNLKKGIENILSKTELKFNTEYKKIYGDTIGDHMKLARQILPEKVKEVINMFQNQLPQEISFERITLVNYDTEEKDILWSKSFPEN